MAGHKAFLLRLDPAVHRAMLRWAEDDLRSLNAQIAFVLRRSLLGEGRLPRPQEPGSLAEPPPADVPE